MKMKTQIKRKAKRMLSLLLTAMLLISTMVVGISTVNAASTLKPTTGEVADGYYRIFVTDNYKTKTTHKLYWWGSKKENPGSWENSKSMNKLVGQNEDSDDVYWYDIPSDITAFIIRPTDNKQSVNLTVSNADLNFSNGAGYYISKENNGNYEYVYWDASDFLPQETKPDVAESVSLIASSATVTSGGSTTLTATLTNKAVSDVTLTLTGGGTTQTATISGNDTTATFTVSPTSTTTYTVTASAENHSPKSATAKINVVGSDTYYLWTSGENNLSSTDKWTRYEFSVDSDGNYNVPKVAVPESGDMYLTVTKTSDNPYNTMVWENQGEAKTNSINNSSYVGGIDQQPYFVSQTNKYYFFLRIYFSKRNGSLSVDYNATTKGLTFKDAGSTPVENVTIKVPTVDNATVTAESGTETAAEGGSLTVAKDSTFKVTVEPDKGYELAEITYNGDKKTASPATFKAAVSGNITVKVNEKVTPTEPSTKPSTEPSTEPTTAPTENVWYLKGSFNKWGETNPLTGSDDTLTTNVYIDSTQVQNFKVWNKNGDKYYGNELSGGSVATEIKDYKLYQKDDPSLELNVKFKPENSGIYKFTFNPKTSTLYAVLVQSGLNAEVSAPESVKAGETFSITAKAIPDSTITPASYKFTIMIGDTVVVNDAESKTEQYTYNRATISKDSHIYTIVKAYDADGNIIAVSDETECSHPVTVAYDELTVKLSADGSEVVAGTEVALTAAATPASYVSSYEFLISKSYDFNDTELVTKTSTSSTLKHKFDTIGTYYVKVVAHNKYGQITNTADATSNIIQITVVETNGEHEVTFYFKAPSAFAYYPNMTLDGTALEVTRDDKLGESFTGSVTFYWYKATTTVDSLKTHTLAVSTRRTNASGSMTGNFYSKEYWLAIDNLMSGKTLANLTSLQPYIRNYYHSPLHTVYAGVADDGTLGFTNIKGTRYAMGTYSEGDPSTANNTLSIKAATAAQKSVTQSETYSEVQTCLLDVNLDGKVDVFDATMIQRALVNIQ